MIFNAYIDGKPEESISCRIFSPSRRAYWRGTVGGVDQGWGTAAQAALQQLPSLNDVTHAGPIDFPEYDVVVEYLLAGDATPLGRDSIPAPAQAGLSAGDVASIVSAAVAPVKSQTDKILFNGQNEVVAAPTLTTSDVAGAVATVVAPVKAQTDRLTFTEGDEVAAAATLVLTPEDKADIITGIKDGTDPLNSDITPGAYPEGTAGAALGLLLTPQEDPGPVFVVPRPANPGLQTLWGRAKDIGTDWADGDAVTVIATGKNPTAGGNLLTDKKQVVLLTDGVFSLPVDKGANVKVTVGHYFSKEITITQDDVKNLADY